jgi:phage terminase small subunit
MARNRTPTAILDAKGAFIINPQRARENEPTSGRPIGPPPKCLSSDEKKVWKLLVKQSLPGVLMESDTTLFMLLVRLTTKLYKNQPLMVGEMSQLISLGSKFAMNPADRSKVSVEQPKESALSTFLNRKTNNHTEDVMQ